MVIGHFPAPKPQITPQTTSTTTKPRGNPALHCTATNQSPTLPSTLLPWRRAREVQQAVGVHLLEVDPPLQQAVLKCMKVFKFKYLNVHMERLLRLANNATLRAELTSFVVAKGADNGVPEDHRPGRASQGGRVS